jgi:hypothetical protein
MSHGVQGQLSSAKAELDLEIHKKIMRLASEKRQAQMEELSMDALIMAGTSSEEVLSLVTSDSKYIKAVTFENFCQVAKGSWASSAPTCRVSSTSWPATSRGGWCRMCRWMGLRGAGGSRSRRVLQHGRAGWKSSSAAGEPAVF